MIFFRRSKTGKGLGLIESPPDPRDYSILQILGPIKEPLESTYKDWSEDIPILGQGATSFCVGFSSSSMKMRQEQKEHGKVLRFDPIWLYNECKKIDGYPDQEGTFVRAAMKVLKNQGIPVYNPLGMRLGLGKKYKITAYYKVPNDPYTIKIAIKQLGPIVVGYKWMNSWYRPTVSGVVPKPDSLAGGHAFLKIGWDDTIPTPIGTGAWECINSWTNKYAKNGHFYIPYGYEKYMTEGYKSVDEKDAPQERTTE